jgi:hypothetical protein
MSEGSEVRKAFEMQAKLGNAGAKWIKYCGWFFIIIGALLTITVIGAIPGILLVLMGVGIIFFSKFLKKQTATLRGATLEQAEIIEHQLRQARSQKPE